MPRVLVIDDDPSTQTLFTAVLRHHGVECIALGDGELALNELRRNRYDAIILDLMMPKVNGFEVLRELKCVSREVLDRVIVCSAISESRLQDCVELSMVHSYLPKPVEISRLAEEVLDLIGSKPALLRVRKGPRDLATITPLRDVS
jgi:two-component system OmpR family response regulator